MGKQLDSQLRGYANAPENMRKDPTYPIFRVGVERGKMATQYEVLTFLEKKYIEDDERPERGSPEAKAILKVAKELAEYLRSLTAEGLIGTDGK